MSLMAKLKKNSKVSGTSVLDQSEFFQEKELTRIDVPMMNVALSGRLDGGLASGLTVLAGPSKHFKTSFALKMASAYLDSDPEAMMLFYDSEFGSPQSYFENFGIDTSRVLHTPITNVEELKFDLINQLEEIGKDDKVIIVIDSIGNLASKKEVEDALDGKSVADMTRAKQLKSLFRMVTPHLNIKDIPMVVVNHTYMEQGMYPKAIVSGGTGGMYSSDNVFVLGRQQEKEGTEIIGYNFIINVEKSRYVKEKSKIPVSVSFDGGISKWSGLLDIALESGHVIKPSNGWYSQVNLETGEVSEKKWRIKDTDSKEFWVPLLTTKSFFDFIANKYQMAHGDIIKDEDIEKELALYED